MGDAKKNKPKKRAAAAFGEIFHYSNQIDFKFGSSFNPSAANAVKTHILNDSSSSEDEEFELLSKQRRSWKKNDDSVVLSDEGSSEDDESDEDKSQPLNDSQDLAPSPPPPPKLDTPTLARQTCRTRASKQSREVESTLFLLKQTTEVQSPSTLSFTSPTSGASILLDDSSPFIPQRSSDRNMVVKVRTRSGVQRFNMKAGDPFSKIVPDISRKENIPEENILLTLRDEGIVMSESPLSLGVTVADILECIVAQNGSPTEESEDDEDTIEVKIQGGDNKQIKTFRIKMNDPLEKLMTKYCSSMKLPRPNVHFSFDGDEIASAETPEDLDMEDGNMIDVKVK